MGDHSTKQLDQPCRAERRPGGAGRRRGSSLGAARSVRRNLVHAAFASLLCGSLWLLQVHAPAGTITGRSTSHPPGGRNAHGAAERPCRGRDAVRARRVLLQRGLQLDGAQQRQQFGAALQQFQRAWWFEHDLVSILEDIVPLAFQLDRKLEATRYLIIAAQQQELPVELLEQVAAQLADLNEFDLEQAQSALQLYQKVRLLQGDSVDLITQFEIGRLSLAVGELEPAAEAFAAVQQVLEDPGHPSISAAGRDQLLQHPEVTYALLGECYVRTKRLDAAEAAFRTADKAKPNAATLGYRLALVEHERGHRETALQHLDQYFAAKTTAAGLAPYVLLQELIDGTQAAPQQQLSPSNPSRSAEQDGENGGSDPPPSSALVEKLTQLAQADPNNPLLGYFLADALQRTEQWEAAVSLYKKLLEQKPAAEGYRGLVEIYRSQKQLEPLLYQLGEVVWKTGSLDPLDSSVEAILADQAVLEELTQLARQLTADPGQPPPHGILMAIALLQGQAEHAELAMEFLQAGLRQPGPAAGQCVVSLAFQMLRADRPQQAAELFQRILDEKLLPDKMAEVSFYLAGAWTLAKDMEKALEAARQACRLEPSSPRMLSREPWVLYQAKRLDEAKTKYVEILDRFDSDYASPENREVLRDIRLVLSAINVELRDLNAAEGWLQQVLDEFPEDISAFNDLGYLWCDQGKHLQRSLQMTRRAVEAEPDNIAYRDSLGWAMFRLGQFQAAVGELEKAAQGDKVDGVIMEHLGDAYAKLDQPTKALEAWQKAAQAFQNQGDNERYQAMEAKIKDNTPH